MSSRLDHPPAPTRPSAAGNDTPSADSGRPIQADQAIFTSVRGTTGSGYRLIAASAGVRPQEKQELTQRCPSHASLTTDSPDGEALVCWKLRTGRYCVVWSRHAGIEHTARGGFRVHNHVVILGEDEYRQFECNPTRVHVALLETLDSEPLLETAATIEPLLLPDPAARLSAWASALGIGCPREPVFAMVEAVLAGQDVIVSGAVPPVPTLDAVFAALPLSFRPALSVSVGLKFSTSRETNLMLLDKKGADHARQFTRGRKVAVIDAEALGSEDARSAPREQQPASYAAGATSPTGGCTTPAEWLKLMRRWWSNGRRREFCRLTLRIEDPTPAGLNRLAAICLDTDNLADPAHRVDLAARYGSFTPQNELERELVASLGVEGPEAV